MATSSFYLDTRACSQGQEAPVKISINHKKASSLISTGIKVLPELWDARRREVKKEHPNSAKINLYLTGKKLQIDSALLSLTHLGDKSARDVRELVLDEIEPSRKETVKEEHLFIHIYRGFMNSRKSEGTRGIYRSALKWIYSYDTEIEKKSISSLDKKWAVGLENKMAETNSKNARNILLRAVRAVFNHAISSEIISSNPFCGMDLRPQATTKRSMSVDTLRRIRDEQLDEWQVEYRDMFMLMFYLIGINAADLFLAKKSQLKDGRIDYVRKKTGRHYSVRVYPEAMDIIKRYEGKNWLLSPMDRYSDYKYYLAHMNRALSKLGTHYKGWTKTHGEPIFEGLSTYWSRHTWATIAYEIGISVDTIGQALGHYDGSHAVTLIYIRLDDKKVDEANRSVIDYINSR